MPKKTKAQKIIAQLRRKLVTQEARKATFLSQPRKNEGSEFQKKRRVEKTSSTFTQPEPKSGNASFSFVVGDLKKSLFLTLLAISLEFMLYYILELGGSW